MADFQSIEEIEERFFPNGFFDKTADISVSQC